MTEIVKGIFTGNEYDFYSIENKDEWAILHCCKNPFHVDFVGYKGNLKGTDPYYISCIKGNEMALNIVDLEYFDDRYLMHNKKMFTEAFEFLDRFRKQGKKLLIHCNQGESRGPSLCMLYIARIGGFINNEFEDVFYEFLDLYPRYHPKANIYNNVKLLWDCFTNDERGI